MSDELQAGTSGRATAVLVAIGSELLLGDLTDTNSAWLSRRLAEHGVEVVQHLTVGDELPELVATIRWALDRAQLVILGGGLGPTADDRTREAVATALDRPLARRPELEEALAGRFAAIGRRMAPQNRRQAELPAGATPIAAVGTAPGFHLEEANGRHLVALPGVPWELQAMFESDVVPLADRLSGGGVTLTRVVHVAGRGESDVAEVVEPLFEGREDVTLAFLAKSHEIEVRLTVWATDRGGALAVSEPVIREVRAVLGAAVVGVDDQRLEEVIVALLRERGRTVATAESATAGDIAARLGRVPGASQVLVGGVVVYQAAAKRRLLGISDELLAAHGTVSEETTRALALAAQERFGVDHAIAVTGVAGPDPVDQLPVGTCYWALTHPDGRVEIHRRVVSGDRGQVIARLGTSALDLLRRRLLDG